MPFPQVGEVHDGYRYQGGDPNSQKSWKFVGDESAAAIPSAPTQDQITAANEVLDAVDTAMEQSKPFGATGFWGSVGSKIGGTKGYNLDRTTDTIKGHLALDKLQAMKAASPNGASGLGSTTENEMRMLQSLAGSLDVGQSRDQFQRNLQSVAQHVGNMAPGVTFDNPLDLSKGQSREALARGTFYRDPMGNIRRNDNGDKGNPIFANSALARALRPGRTSAPVQAPVSTPPAGAIQMLRGNPQLAAQFDQKYGQGAAARALGR